MIGLRQGASTLSPLSIENAATASIGVSTLLARSYNAGYYTVSFRLMKWSAWILQQYTKIFLCMDCIPITSLLRCDARQWASTRRKQGGFRIIYLFRCRLSIGHSALYTFYTLIGVNCDFLVDCGTKSTQK